MLGPSPDWNVGLSGEDLCTKDCGWVQRLVTDLIPWDAGTDGGVTYEVRRLTLLSWGVGVSCEQDAPTKVNVYFRALTSYLIWIRKLIQECPI